MYRKNFNGPTIRPAPFLMQSSDTMTAQETTMWYNVLRDLHASSEFDLYIEEFYLWVEDQYGVVYVRDELCRLVGIIAPAESITLLRLKFPNSLRISLE